MAINLTSPIYKSLALRPSIILIGLLLKLVTLRPIPNLL